LLEVVVVGFLMEMLEAEVLPKLEVEEADLCSVAVDVLEGRPGVEEFVVAATAVVVVVVVADPEERGNLGFGGKGRVLYLLLLFVPVGTRQVPVVSGEVGSLSVEVGAIEGSSGVALLSLVVDDRVIDTLLASFSASFNDLRDEEEDVLVAFDKGVGFAMSLDADLEDNIDLGALFITLLSSTSPLGLFRLF